MVQELTKYLTEFKSEIGAISELISEPSPLPDDQTVLSDASQFLETLNLALQDLQKKSIFLSLIFLDNPTPNVSDIKGSCEEMKKSTLLVSSVALKSPKTVGKTLLHSWQQHLRYVSRDVTDFVDGMLKSAQSKDTSAVKTTIGRLCHDVESLSKLPKSNKKAACLAANSGLALVEDALEELTADDFPIRSTADNPENTMEQLMEALGVTDEGEESSNPEDSGMESDPNNTTTNINRQHIIQDDSNTSMLPDEFVSLESMLSDVELRQLIQISIGLVKTVRSCLKKACTVLSFPESSSSSGKQDGPEVNEAQNQAIDEIIECCNKMSPSSDEFVLALYPPRRARLLESEATDLAAAMRKLLNAISQSGLIDTDQDRQMDILSKAVDHNSTKLISFLNAQIH